ncbi:MULTISPECIES: protein psiB [Rhizobium]|uniref:Protein psiB n=2 Tax=Rhizobium TaxID=379 RepID=A0A387FZE1_9HYPH|nr:MULTISPECIES: protein psiB [Rhizobium]AYG64029.1 protein psiB [Rhizobium jaguaris]MDL2403503.1 protein psiB [Rhizobium mayense]
MKKIAYVLESETALFRAVKLHRGGGDSIAPIYDLIGGRVIEMIRFDEKHWLFFDEDALRDGLTAFTIFDGCPKPLAGNIVLIGGDGGQLYRSPLITIADAAARFQCCRPVLDPVFVTTDDMTSKGLILAGALASLQVRIDRRPPMLEESRYHDNHGSIQ